MLERLEIKIRACMRGMVTNLPPNAARDVPSLQDIFGLDIEAEGGDEERRRKNERWED